MALVSSTWRGGELGTAVGVGGGIEEATGNGRGKALGTGGGSGLLAILAGGLAGAGSRDGLGTGGAGRIVGMGCGRTVAAAGGGDTRDTRQGLGSGGIGASGSKARTAPATSPWRARDTPQLRTFMASRPSHFQAHFLEAQGLDLVYQ